ncbi:hypothetical protein K0H71_09665 [Bacillus sp. IITD106]|nr:hypothetical protein [Bacillus sp. IITD106]
MAIIIHIAFSIIVLYAIKESKVKYLFLAIGNGIRIMVYFS